MLTPDKNIELACLNMSPVSSFVERIKQSVLQISQAPELYRHRLVVTVVPPDLVKALPFREIANQFEFQYVNVNLELSQLLLDVPIKQRPLRAVRLLNDEIIQQRAQQGLVLDYLDILFDPGLELAPMRCLLDVARRYTVVARWVGSCKEGYLIRAEPGHPEYGQYWPEEAVIVQVESNPGSK